MTENNEILEELRIIRWHLVVICGLLGGIIGGILVK